MSHFTTSLMELLYQGESIDELIRLEIEKAVNELLQQELTALLEYDKYEFAGYGSGNSRNGQYERQVQTRFGSITVVMPRDRNWYYVKKKYNLNAQIFPLTSDRYGLI